MTTRDKAGRKIREIEHNVSIMLHSIITQHNTQKQRLQLIVLTDQTRNSTLNLGYNDLPLGKHRKRRYKQCVGLCNNVYPKYGTWVHIFVWQ